MCEFVTWKKGRVGLKCGQVLMLGKGWELHGSNGYNGYSMTHMALGAT